MREVCSKNCGLSQISKGEEERGDGKDEMIMDFGIYMRTVQRVLGGHMVSLESKRE